MVYLTGRQNLYVHYCNLTHFAQLKLIHILHEFSEVLEPYVVIKFKLLSIVEAKSIVNVIVNYYDYPI